MKEDSNEPGVKKQIFGDFLPKSHTCTNILKLPRGTHCLQLPPEDALLNFMILHFSVAILEDDSLKRHFII